MTLEDLPLGRGSHIIDGDGTIMSTDCQPLRFMMKGNHGKHLDHNAKDNGDDLVRVLPQGKLIRIKALQQNLGDLNQMML